MSSKSSKPRRRPSLDRAANVSKMTPEAVKALREKADKAVKSEEDKFKKPKVGSYKVLQKSMEGNWKTRFLLLKRDKKTLETFKSGDLESRKGEGSPKTTLKISSKTKVKVLDEKESKKNVVHVKDGSTEIFFAAKDAKDASSWKKNVEATIAGFKLPRSIQAQVHEAERAEREVASKKSGESTGETKNLYDMEHQDIDVSQLPPYAQEELAGLDEQVKKGVLSKEEADQLRPILINQALEDMAGLYDEDESIAFTTEQTAREKPADEEELCNMKYKGGKFICFMLKPEVLPDIETWTPKTFFVFGCQFMKKDEVIESWTVKKDLQWIKVFFHEPASQIKGMKIPAFPKIDDVETISEENITKQKDSIKAYVRELFSKNAGKNEEKFLAQPLVEQFFRLHECTLDTFDSKKLESDYVKNYKLDEGKPLDKKELKLADETADRFLKAIRGDDKTRAMSIFDPTISQYENVCADLRARLLLTLDTSTSKASSSSAKKAGEVLKKVEDALALYQDALSVAIATMG